VSSLLRLRFSLSDLPPEVDDRARLALWREHYSRMFDFETSFLPDRRIQVETEFAQAGFVKMIRLSSTLSAVTRTPRHVAATPQDELCLTFNAGGSPWLLCQNGREVVAGPGHAVLHANAEPHAFRNSTRNACLGVGVERLRLAELIAHPEDLAVRPFDPDSPAMRHLGRYLALIMGPDGIGDDAGLNEHIGATLVDLLALALGAGRDAAELARLRGRRAALLCEIAAAIRRGFADPAFSAERIAAKLRLSSRTVQNLLHESGTSFFERVMELRLQRARTMLADPRYDRLKVIEIAHACGFNEVSYFHRCFRHRFGATPTHYRGNGAR
jgi:AraC-like DNA-binding protein